MKKIICILLSIIIIPMAAFADTLFSLFGWNTDCKYRIMGSLYEENDELAYIFDTADSEVLLKSYVLPTQEFSDKGCSLIKPLTPYGKRILAIPEERAYSFGEQFYLHELTLAAIENQSESDWKIRIEGQLFKTGVKLNVTGFDKLKQYIKHELGGITLQEVYLHE